MKSVQGHGLKVIGNTIRYELNIKKTDSLKGNTTSKLLLHTFISYPIILNKHLEV